MPNGESSTSKEGCPCPCRRPPIHNHSPSNNQVVQDDDGGYGIEYKMVMDLLVQVMSNSGVETASKIKQQVVEAFIRVDTADDPAPADDTTTPQRRGIRKGGELVDRIRGRAMKWSGKLPDEAERVVNWAARETLNVRRAVRWEAKDGTNTAEVKISLSTPTC